MKKGSISILIVLVLSVLININYVNAATITINGEQWDESKKCVYATNNCGITIYYKGTQTILKDTCSLYKDEDGNQLYIKNDGNPVQYTAVTSFEVTNSIVINEYEGCPQKIYRNYRGYSNFTVSDYNNDEEKANIFQKLFQGKGTSTYELFSSPSTQPSSKPSTDNRQPCEKIIDESTKQLINKYLGYIHIIVPMLIIALGTYDFFRAIIASKEDEMKKAQKRFIVRLVSGVFVFLAPTIVNIIIDILNSTLVGNKVCELSISIQNYVY